MRTVIIGGTEFIGPHIVERLVKRGHDVAVLHRRDRHDLGPHVRNLQADRGDLGAIAQVLRQERPEVVFDLAYDWGKGTTAVDVVAAARNAGDRLTRYVFMSSIAAYGPGLNRRESDPLAPDDTPNPYAQHKASTERALFRLHETSGFPVTTFRPPFVHGPRQPFYREQFFWDRLLDGRPIILPEDGESPMQWAFVEDLAEACVRAIEVPEAVGQAFNMAHVEPTTQRGSSRRWGGPSAGSRNSSRCPARRFTPPAGTSSRATCILANTWICRRTQRWSRRWCGCSA